MSWRSLFTSGSNLEPVEQQLVEMLRLDQHSLDLAHRGLRGDGDIEALRSEISDTDHRVNLAVQEVRRQLLIHAAVNEELADIPAMFTYMSLVKDIERIGDYAKNILDIARARSGHPAADLDDAAVHADQVTSLLRDVIEVFKDHDIQRAQQLLDASTPVLQALDRMVDELTVTDQPGHVAVPRALYCRYLKRIAAHLQNVLTSLTEPVDRLDFQP